MNLNFFYDPFASIDKDQILSNENIKQNFIEFIVG